VPGCRKMASGAIPDDGRTSLDVAAVVDPNLMNKDQISKGDRVGVEIDLNDRITKMTKLSGQPSAADTQMRDDLKP
jgi:hypothetical protein